MNAAPFAIVEQDCRPCDDGSRVVELTEGRPGLLPLEENRLSGPLIELPERLGQLLPEENNL